MTHFILDEDHNVVEVPLLVWAEWFEHHENRIVKQTMTKRHWVSTVFLGIDHQTGSGPPLLFETMVFHREYVIREDHKGRLYRVRDEVSSERHTTWAQAEQAHDAIVRLTEQEEA